MLGKVFGKELNVKYIHYFKDVYSLAHNITHGNIRAIKGKDLDLYRERAEDFVKEMQKLMKKLS